MCDQLRYWQDEFAGYDPRSMREAIAPIQNKVGQDLSRARSGMRSTHYKTLIFECLSMRV
jgi:hypothetical protein